MKRTEKDLHISSFHLNFAVKCKKTAHKCCNFQKYFLSLTRRSEKWTTDIEKSSLALTRLRTWKIRSIRVKSLKAASPAVAYILLILLGDWLTYIPAGVS